MTEQVGAASDAGPGRMLSPDRCPLCGMSLFDDHPRGNRCMAVGQQHHTRSCSSWHYAATGHPCDCGWEPEQAKKISVAEHLASSVALATPDAGLHHGAEREGEDWLIYITSEGGVEVSSHACITLMGDDTIQCQSSRGYPTMLFVGPTSAFNIALASSVGSGNLWNILLDYADADD